MLAVSMKTDHCQEAPAQSLLSHTCIMVVFSNTQTNKRVSVAEPSVSNVIMGVDFYCLLKVMVKLPKHTQAGSSALPALGKFIHFFVSL